MGSTHCHQKHVHEESCAFRIAWSINPHMEVGRACDPELAREEHLSLKNTLIRLGAEVVELPFIQSAYDSVFTKDVAVLLTRGKKGTAVICNARHRERRLEKSAREKQLKLMGFEVVHVEGLHLEGGDVVVCPNQSKAFLGHGFRSSRAATQILEDVLGHEVVPLELRDPYLYHLDTAMTALEGGWVLACREAFTPPSWKRLEQCVSPGQLLEIPRFEALRFGANILEVGQKAILGSFVPQTYSLLKKIGIQPLWVPLTQFHRAGGSAACLAARVHSLEQMMMPTAAIRSTLEYSGLASSSPKISGSISA
jgi:N-dimethylarginine dimethylaminohydrolase